MFLLVAGGESLGSASQYSTPTKASPRSNQAAVSAVSTVNTPQHSPEQLDFGSVADGLTSAKTFSLTTNGAGYVTLSIPAGPFRVAEFREMAAVQGGSKNRGGPAAVTATTGVRSRIKYQEGQRGPYQWSMDANAEIQVDLIFAPSIKSGNKVGAVSATMNVSGPGPRGNWSLAIPISGALNNLANPLVPQGPTPKSSSQGGSSGQARSIASTTPDDRMRLPDDTVVSVQSGRTTRSVSMGTLRAEHRARVERFASAAALGRTVAGNLQPPSSAPLGPGGTASQSTPMKAMKSGAGGSNQGSYAAPAKTSAFATIVPFKPPTAHGTIPNDYVDFCKAANATACIYLPANAPITDPDINTSLYWVMDFDWLITDTNVCAASGGYAILGGCAFYYPRDYAANFTPTGPLSTTVSCNAPAVQQFDPKGAARVFYPSPYGTVTLNKPATCVVQVWMSK
jgi:hypothetical protein